jgi:hypothetical protein
MRRSMMQGGASLFYLSCSCISVTVGLAMNFGSVRAVVVFGHEG